MIQPQVVEKMKNEDQKKLKRKARTQKLIELGGLVAKAKLDNLKSNTLYGALLTLKYSLSNDLNVKDKWTEIGRNQFDLEEKEKPMKIQFDTEPDKDTKICLRSFGLKFDPFGKEWYGHRINIISLQEKLNGQKYEIKYEK